MVRILTANDVAIATGSLTGGLLLGRIRRQLAVLDFWSDESIEDFTMNPVGPCIVSLIITDHPLLKVTKHAVLKFKRSVLM